jgi:hypothetical protein
MKLWEREGETYGQAGGVKIVIADDNYEKAKTIISEFEKSRND